MNVATPQSWHDVWLELACVPAEHLAQVAEPVPVAIVPSAHGTQANPSALNVPAAHRLHEPFAGCVPATHDMSSPTCAREGTHAVRVPFDSWPGGHALQDAAPAFEIDPAGHGVHVAPLPSVPAGQVTHCVRLRLVRCPTVQAKQLVAPGDGATVPLLQGVHGFVPCAP